MLLKKHKKPEEEGRKINKRRGKKEKERDRNWVRKKDRDKEGKSDRKGGKGRKERKILLLWPSSLLELCRLMFQENRYKIRRGFCKVFWNTQFMNVSFVLWGNFEWESSFKLVFFSEICIQAGFWPHLLRFFFFLRSVCGGWGAGWGWIWSWKGNFCQKWLIPEVTGWWWYCMYFDNPLMTELQVV